MPSSQQIDLTLSSEDNFWGEVQGAAKALTIARLAESLEHPLIVVTHDIKTALALEAELAFFLTEDSSSLPVLLFPDWETLPYDHFSPHQDLISQRLATLAKLPMLKRGILLAPMTTLMHRITPVDYITESGFQFEIGQRFNPEQTRQVLQERGYYAVSQVHEHGEFSLRGSIFDFFPMGSPMPYRIDLFDDEIDTIQIFDPQTQRSTENITSVNLLPAKEFPLTDEAISRFRQRWRDAFAGNPANCPIYQDVSQGISSNGVEYYLPFFFENTASLLDYVSPNATLVRLEGIHKNAQQFWREITECYEQHSCDVTRPLLKPNEVFYTVEEVFQQINQYRTVTVSQKAVTATRGRDFATQTMPPVMVNHRLDNPILALEEYLKSTNGAVLICAESPGRKDALKTLLLKQKLQTTNISSWKEFIHQVPSLGITVAPLTQGVYLSQENLTIITESELYGSQVFQQRRRQQQTIQSENTIRNLAELTIGSPVVHLEHGVGRYLGLTTMNSGDQTNEFLVLEYAGNDKLYVPISALDLISRYSGVEVENAPINRLGTNKWQKAKEKAAKQLHDVAAELLELYAKRASRKGHQFSIDESLYAQFAANFPFEETADQAKAIEQVLEDLSSPQPMDRLVCGDVGFGKTEVAMRAAFVTVMSNKQVAILVPTTLLAQQHYETFCDRFADWPVTVEVVSRFKTAKQQQLVLDKLAEGKVDIIIGTHKLLFGDINFKSLGLLIIDEEHRFGVRQKEKLKHLRAEVDMLNLTATPIPRTLNMAMSGIRDLSIIATPPAKRLSIKTFVLEKNNQIIREAIMREIMRGGQVYFLHNNVESIQMVAHELEQLVPEARLSVGHGQMRERELEQVMSDFYHQRFNVLVCTTIIETGIDIPSANTIVINRADRFGLAQLHQLRGRVGRSHHQAYAYLITPDKNALSSDAKKRLQAISSLEDLGIGFTLASHDLEIRGAGELLGDEQSGNIHDIGLTLYTELLDKTIAAMKAGKTLSLTAAQPETIEVDLKVTALFPEDYLPDVHTRLILYKRIAGMNQQNELDDLRVEIIDRFGPLPEQVENLFRLATIKCRCKEIGIRKIEAGLQGGRLEFIDNPSVEPLTIIQLVQRESKRYQLLGSHGLSFKWPQSDQQQRFRDIETILNKLQQPQGAPHEH